MSRPLLLDLFCGAGGATRGYQDAGFHVLGVDINPQPNYCGDEFIQYDALAFLDELKGPVGLLVDAIHASPPCQRYTALAKGNNGNETDYPDLIPPVREKLRQLRRPFVIENVPPAPLHNPITLCGEMFGLGVIRHRAFESNVMLMQPPHVPHRGRVAGWRHGQRFDGPYCAVYGDGGGKGSLDDWRKAMGMPWCREKREIAEAIPPAYTAYIGAQLLDAVRAVA